MIREEDISSTVLVHFINIIFFKSLGKCPHSVCTKYIILKNISSLENIYILMYVNFATNGVGCQNQCYILAGCSK